MKKIFYLMSSLMLVFTACDPMEDVYEELDKSRTDTTEANIELTKEDYALFSKDTEHPHVASKQYFTNEAEAAVLLPTVLNKKYAHLNNGAIVTITYNALVFPGVSNNVSSWEAYTVTAADYLANGEKFSNFNSSSDVYKFLDTKYPSPTEGQLAVLTYDYYSGSTSTITDSFYFINGDWENIYHVSAADYLSVKNNFASFSGSDSGLMPAYFDLFLSKDNIGAKTGDLRYVSYYFYDSSSKTRSQRVMAMYFNGSSWMPAVGATQVASLKFQKKNNTWEPDLRILYKLESADYTWIAAQEGIADAAALASLGRYRNFDTSLWSADAIIKALGALLHDKFPNAKVGQKFNITYVIYSGATSATSITLELGADGNYKLAE